MKYAHEIVGAHGGAKLLVCIGLKKIGYTSLLTRRSQLSLTNGRGSGLHVAGADFDVAGGKNNFA